MSRLTGRLGGAAARHPWRTIAAWLILIVALFGLKMAFGGQLQDDYARVMNLQGAWQALQSATGGFSAHAGVDDLVSVPLGM